MSAYPPRSEVNAIDFFHPWRTTGYSQAGRRQKRTFVTAVSMARNMPIRVGPTRENCKRSGSPAVGCQLGKARQ